MRMGSSGRRLDGTGDMGNSDFSWVGALGAVNLFLFAWSATGAAGFLAQEQGVLQIGQLILIALAMFLFLVPVIRNRGPARTAAVALVGVSLCCFYRELDLAAFGVTGPMAAITTSAIRDIVLTVGVLLLLGYIARNRADIPAWWRFATRAEAWPLIASGILLVIGILLDALLEGDLQGKFWEELVEFNSYVLFVLAAGRHTRVAGYEDVVERPIVPI